jgi:adenylate cyclase class IV
MIHIIFNKISANSFQIKLKDRSTATNLLDEELLKDVIKKSKKRREERKGSILLEIARVIDYCRYTTIKVKNRESKKGKRLRKTRRFTI